MKEIKEAGSEVSLGLFYGLASLGFFLMLGLCSTNNSKVAQTDFQYCDSKYKDGKSKCFEQLKQLRAYD